MSGRWGERGPGKRWHREFRGGGYRITIPRQIVLQVLDESKKHLSAEDIFLKVHQIYPTIGLTTVYRTLELLDKLKIIYRLESGDGQSRYELSKNSELHYHHHLICLDCGTISEFKDDLLEEVEAKIEASEDFEVVDHTLKFYGYCAKCKSKK